MIDEVESENEGNDHGSDNSNKEPRDLTHILDEDIDEEDTGFFSKQWVIVNDRKKKKRYTESTIELKDLTEGDFLELIEAKNQDKRFFGCRYYLSYHSRTPGYCST